MCYSELLAVRLSVLKSQEENDRCHGARYQSLAVSGAGLSTSDRRLARLFNRLSLLSVLLDSNKPGTKCSSDEST